MSKTALHRMQHHVAARLLFANIIRVLPCLLTTKYHTGEHKHSYHTPLLLSAQSTSPTASGVAHHHHQLALIQPACWCSLHSQAVICCCCQHCLASLLLLLYQVHA
jgi:hypothetical protein